jgi:hypothetical protein
LRWRHFISRVNTSVIKVSVRCCQTGHRVTGQAAAGDCKTECFVEPLRRDTVTGPQKLWLAMSVAPASATTYCLWAVRVTHGIMTASTLATAVNRVIPNGVFHVVETHAGLWLSCQAIQCLWLVHTVASVEAALHSGDTLSPTGLIRYSVWFNSSRNTLSSNLTQISNHHFLDICWLISICRKMLVDIISTAVMFLLS